MRIHISTRRHYPGIDDRGLLLWFWRCPGCGLVSAAHLGCHEANNAARFHAGGCEWLRRRVVRPHRLPLAKADGRVA